MLRALNNIYAFILTQWIQIANIGFQEGLSLQMQKKLRVTNALTFLAILFCLPLSIAIATNKNFISTLFILFSDCLLLVTYYFNEKKKYELARLWLIVVANISIFPHAILFGEQSGIPYLYFTLCGTPFLVFELKRKWHILISVSISIVLFFILCVESNLHMVYFIPPVFNAGFFVPMIGLAILLHISNIYYFIRINQNADKSLEILKRRAELEIENAQKVINSSKANDNHDSIATILRQQILELECSKKELKESNDKLTRINNRMDDFIYTTSHDLKSPFANIEALLEVIKSSRAIKNEEVKELVEMMSISVNKFKDTVWNLTKINQVNGNFGLYHDDLVLEDLVEELKVGIQNQIKDTGAQIVCNFKKAPKILFSKKNMRSILFNMVSNAIKYRSPDRSPLVILTSSFKDNFFIIEIKDNGLGIPVSSRNKVFSLFQRAHNHVEGSGIGLYIVNRIIENNDGKIELESTEGEGTTFRIYINLTSHIVATQV